MFSLPNNVQSIGNVLDNGIKLFITGFKHVVILSFAANLLMKIPNLIFSDISEQPSGSELMMMLGIFFVAYLAFMVIYFAIVYRFWGITKSDMPDINDSLKHGLACLIPIFISSILYVLVIAGGFILLIIPGIILSLSLFFYSYCILLNGDGIVNALKNSHRLIWGNWWRSAVILTVPLFIIIGLYMILGAVLTFTLFQDLDALAQGDINTMWFDIGNMLVGTVTGPLFTSISLVLFYDLKMRKEGGDIQQRIESMS